MAGRDRNATWPRDRANRISVKAAETLAANRTITPAEVERYQLMAFNAVATGRTITLPPEESSAGVQLFIINASSGAAALTVQNDAAGAVTVIQQSESGMVVCDGTSWFAMTGAVNS
ncbi:hypothetical protein HH310_12545 [Actinoplanes sp. TBRC 11911]|uniref:hypothetical protein n=1 Tax=Actinoplanes sp. TBRC 11911 TaxID=2729386 RepID=UPI00145CAA85|nr:hypothetical protein [Actinoplanes sp. TBRC 11911]NMO52022.1 hypothetical protein [Actinoplanes sp. TBRC 11911]